MNKNWFIRLCKGLTGIIAGFTSAILLLSSLTTANLPAAILFFMTLVGSGTVCLEALTNEPLEK